MPAEIGPCRRCGHTVERSARRCRACGYETDPKWNETMTFVLGVYGTFLACTVVLAPLGALALWKARLHHRALTRGLVATGDPPSVRELARAVFEVRPGGGRRRRGGDAPGRRPEVKRDRRPWSAPD